MTAGNIDRAIKLCDAGDYPTLQLVKAGLTHANKGPDEIDAAMSEKMGELRPAVEKRIGSLWSLANIATLIGLIGTVVGLITTFSAVSDPRLSAAAAPGAALARYLGGHVQHRVRSRHRRDLHDRAPHPAPALEEHSARPGRDAGAGVQPAHDPDASPAATDRRPEPAMAGEREKLSAAQRSRIRRLSMPKELAPDEEGGELNIVPFLDIITNVLMFVLATISVTFTTMIESQPPRAAGSSARPPTKPSLSLNIIVIDKGFIVSAFGRASAKGARGPEPAWPSADGRRQDYDYPSLTACAKRLKNQVPEAADETAATAHREQGHPLPGDHRHRRRHPPRRRRARALPRHQLRSAQVP